MLVRRELARSMWQISVEAVRLVRALVEQHEIECDLATGHVEAALNPRQQGRLLESKRMLEEHYEYSGLELLNREQLQAFVTSPAYCAGLLDPHALHLHPLNYTLELARAACHTGVEIFERSTVVKLELQTPTRVQTAQGAVVADFVVLCCNAYIDGIAPQLRSRIMPVGTYMLATEPLGEDGITATLPKNVAISDANFILDYFRRTPDGRLLFGGQVSYSGLHARMAREGTRRHMLKIFPHLRNAKVEFAWGGYIDITMNRAPDFNRLAANIYYLQGFSGHGIALASMAGKLVAEAIAGQAERFDWFSNIPHRHFPGGALRTPALALAMLWYRFRDALGR